MPAGGKTKPGMGKRRRRPLTQVKSGIALSNLAITAPLPTRLGGPLRRGHSKRSLTRINSKGMEINVSVDGLERTKSGSRLTSNDNNNSNVVVVAQESFITSRTARVLLAGAGFLADAYDLFVINLVLRLLKDEYPQYALGGQLHMLEGSVASAALVGSILGQLVAGSLADIIGRKRIFVTTAALITIGCIGSACALDTPSLTIYGQIACWRTLLGAGVGGEYPLAATVTSESTSAGKRGSLMSAVFAMQGIGSLLSGCIVYLCLMLGCSTAFTWRFALAFGAVPVMIAFPYRLRMHETESFSRLQQERQQQHQKQQQQQHHTAAGGARRRTSSSSSLSRTLSGGGYGGGVRRGGGGSKNKLSDYDIASSLPPGTNALHPPQRGSSSDVLQQYHHEIVMIEEELPLMDPSPPPKPAAGSMSHPPLPPPPQPPSASNYRSLEDAPAPYFTTNAAAALSSAATKPAATAARNNTAGGAQQPPSLLAPPSATSATTTTTGNFITTADGQYFYQQDATRYGGGGGGGGPGTGNGNGTGTGNGSSAASSLSSSLKPSASATPIPGSSSTPPPAATISAAVVASLPPAQKAELISVFHAPVTPSSSPVQSLTSQYLDAADLQEQQQQQQQQQAQEAGAAIMGGGHSSYAATMAATSKAPTTMMDVFRQFHRYRTNSADLTDDYGLYHIDSRHNSSNYSQTMMHMMGSTGTPGSVGSYGYMPQQHTSPTSHPPTVAGAAVASPTTAATASGGGAHGSSSLMITPMFAKVKSRGLLSKAATGGTAAVVAATMTTPPSTAAAAGHHAYPAPTSSLVHHRYQPRPMPTRRGSSDESTALIPGTKCNGGGGTGTRRKASAASSTDETRWNDASEASKDMAHAPSSTTMTTTGAEWMRRFQETWRVLSIYRWHIFGTAMSWFLLDVVFYANGLFNHEVTSHIFATTTPAATGSNSNDASSPIHRALEGGFSSSSSSVMVTKTSAQEDAFHSILLSMIALPGYILAVLYLETVGRKRLQMAGFFIMAMLFMLCAVGYDAMLSDDTTGSSISSVPSTTNGSSDPSTAYGSDPSTANGSSSSVSGGNMWGKYLFLLLYALTFLFSNFGPNTTSFVIPGEIYPAEVRATCHGLSAASGKLGAAAGAYFFPMLLAYQSRTEEATDSSTTGVQRAMAVCAFIALLGVLVTHFFIPRYDSHTLALADARFDAEDDEEGDEEDEGDEGDDGESEEDDRKGHGDEDMERGRRRRRSRASTTAKASGGGAKTMKLIVIALDQDCLQTVRENDPRYSDVCLIRHQDDEYCENVDREGHHHRHYHDLEDDEHHDEDEDDPLHDTRGYGSRDARRGVKRGGGGGVGMGMYRSVDAYDDHDHDLEGAHHHAATTRRGRERTSRSGHHSGHSSGHSSSHSTSRTNRGTGSGSGGPHRHEAMQMQEEIHGVHDYAMWEDEDLAATGGVGGDGRSVEPSVGHPTIEMRSWTATTGNNSSTNTKTTVVSAGGQAPPPPAPRATTTVSGQRPEDHDDLLDEDNNNDDSDMSDSELYRRLEEARMLYELRERESASSACL